MKQRKNNAKNLDAHGHNDWRLPTHTELNLLFQNRNQGALKETFIKIPWYLIGHYWSSTSSGPGTAWCQRFYGGAQISTLINETNMCVRCVRPRAGTAGQPPPASASKTERG